MTSPPKVLTFTRVICEAPSSIGVKGGVWGVETAALDDRTGLEAVDVALATRIHVTRADGHAC